MSHQETKGEAFRALHERDGAFIVPNPWDAGTAKLFATAGFEALATTGAGYAFSLGQRDGSVGRDLMLDYVERIVAATDLPVSADLENGFAVPPEDVAETIRLGAECGLVGASIQDDRPERDGLLDLELAADRIRAAVEEARRLPFPFVLTARCEDYLYGNGDLGETIRRLQAYQEAGADVLYAPGMDLEAIQSVVESVDRPVNAVAGLKEPVTSVESLAEIGVKRISLGSTLARLALGELLRASREMLERGTFSFAERALPYAQVVTALGCD